MQCRYTAIYFYINTILIVVEILLHFYIRVRVITLWTLIFQTNKIRLWVNFFFFLVSCVQPDGGHLFA